MQLNPPRGTSENNWALVLSSTLGFHIVVFLSGILPGLQPPSPGEHGHPDSSVRYHILQGISDSFAYLHIDNYS